MMNSWSLGSQLSYGDPFGSCPGPSPAPAPAADRPGKKPDAFFSAIRGIFDRNFAALDGRIEGARAAREARRERMVSLLEAAYETVKEAQRGRLDRGAEASTKESRGKAEDEELRGLTREVRTLSTSVANWTQRVQRHSFFDPSITAKDFKNLHQVLDSLALKNLEKLKMNRKLTILRDTKSFGYRGKSLEAVSDSDSDSESDSEGSGPETPCKTVKKRKARRRSPCPATESTAKK